MLAPCSSTCLAQLLRSSCLRLGKDRNAYLLNRNNLGGITAPVAQASVPVLIEATSAVTYHTGAGNLYCFSHEFGAIRAYKITATSPPTIMFAWSETQTGRGSPWVTTTDGTNNTIVWVVGTGTGGDQRLHGYDGDTGAVIYAGGGDNELMTGHGNGTLELLRVAAFTSAPITGYMLLGYQLEGRHPRRLLLLRYSDRYRQSNAYCQARCDTEAASHAGAASWSGASC